jgi:16S rRNA (guanine(966)-N(2))-methyltransferase RsmD
MPSQRKASSASGVEHKLHRQLRIVGGRAAGRRLLSSRGAQTRPMMEKVRQAIFNMVLAQAGATSVLPPGSRWLDLFAGTASVGLEALSRGASEAHFVEMDPWVVRNITAKNIAACGYSNAATVHTTRAEDFLRRAAEMPSYAGYGFDFISVCPPYLLVSYPELYELLKSSPLVKPSSIVLVEYPKQLAHQVLDQLGPLVRVRNRKYGRTYVALYAPDDGSSAGGCQDRAEGAPSGSGCDDEGLALLGLQLPPA